MWGYQLYSHHGPPSVGLCVSWVHKSFKFLAPAIWAEEVWDNLAARIYAANYHKQFVITHAILRGQMANMVQSISEIAKDVPDTMKNVKLSVIFAPWPSLALGHTIWESQKRSLIRWEVWRRLTSKWNSLMKTQFSPMRYNNKKERNQSHLACIFRGWKVLIA